MIVNRENLNAVFVNLTTTFNKAFEAAPAVWNMIATRVPSTSASNDYKWIAMFPKMREWIGEKVIKNLAAFRYQIFNKDYEATVSVDRNDIEDDNLGIYAPAAQDAGFSAKQWPDELVIDLVNKGFTSPCYDGQYFFDTDHPVGTPAVSVSNKGTAKLSIATLAAAQESYGVARTALRKVKDDEFRPLNLVGDTLVVPPAQEDTTTALMTVDRLEDGKPNPYKGTAKVVVDGRLTSDTAWFLLCTTRPVKPFVFQERKAPVFVQQTDPDSDDVFNKREYKFGAEARGNAGYGLWQMAYGSDGSV